MEKKKEIQGNYFGRKLEQVLLYSGVKSATVAAALSYDVSYISKWITGKALPSRKNMEKVLAVISELIISNVGEEEIRNLREHLGLQNVEKLQEHITDLLWEAYYETTGQLNENQYVNNAVLKAAPRGDFPLFDGFAREVRGKSVKAVVMADLFAMDRASKLRLAGIESGRFRLQDKHGDIAMDYIIDLRSLKGESVYDVILLIHMITNFSQCDFHLYYSKWAGDKLVIALQDEFAGVSVMTSNHQFLCSSSTRDKKTANEIYDTTRGIIEPDKQVFFATDMDSMLLNHEYFHNLLSQQNRWLVGHVTERFLPKELFDRLSEECFASEPQLQQEAGRACAMTANALEKGRVRIMFYHLALVGFVLSGELDFFGRKVILSVEDRMAVMQHIRRMMESVPADKIRMVKEGFSDDFKYITNPCLFLSDTVPYLRLENKLYRDDLLLVKDETVKSIFDDFFETIWNDEGSLVLTDHEEILRKTENLIETINMM